MAGDCAYETHYVNDDTFGNKQLFGRNQELAVDGILDTVKGGGDSIKTVVSSPYFEIIDGVLYRKKLEKGCIRYREVLDRNRQRGAIAAFHEESTGKRHRALDDTYRTVADNYWWEGMYFQIREYVLACPQCEAQRRREEVPGEPCVSRTLASHGNAVLSKLSSQREAGLFCDITLKTGSRSFPAHRAVLAAVSEYFQEIFVEMDSDGQPTIDLTGFREESVLPLLEFSYTSTLRLRAGDLPEVSALAQHFRMWPAVEACRALQSERGGATPRSSVGAFHERPRPTVTSREEVWSRRRNRGWSLGVRGAAQSREGPTPACEPSNDALSGRGRESRVPSSPAHRLKLMDFKSPSSKLKTPSKPLPTAAPLYQAQQSPLLACPKTCSQRLSWSDAEAGLGAGLGAESAEAEQGEDEEGQSSRAQEKYRLLSMLGLQRRSLLPRPEELTGWRQKKRLRKLKVSSYALTAPRKPRAPPPCPAAGLPLSNGPAPPSSLFLLTRIKTEPPEPISMEDMRLSPGRGRGHGWGMAGVGTERQELRRSVRGRTTPPCGSPPKAEAASLPSRRSVRVKQEPDTPPVCPPPPPAHSTQPRPRGRPRKYPPHHAGILRGQSAVQPSGVRPRGRPKRGGKPTPVRPFSVPRAVKQEPADALPVSSATPAPLPAPLPTGRCQRQSKPPLKLLDPGFVFPWPGVGVKQEEVGVDVWQSRPGPPRGESVSGVRRTRHSLRHARAGQGSDRKQLRAPVLKKRRVRPGLLDRGATGGPPRPAPGRTSKTKQNGELPKKLRSVTSLHRQRLAPLESSRRARVKRLRERRSPSHSPVTSHTCLQCKAAYQNCVALIMHRIRHIEGKHWPCPLCSKTFFRQRNVRSHIRTHDPKLYKCSRCISLS